MKELMELVKVSAKLIYHVLFIIGLIAFIIFAIIKFV